MSPAILTTIGELRDLAESLQTFARLVIDERDADKKVEWQARYVATLSAARTRLVAIEGDS